MRVLVTGGAGFIGSHLCRRLLGMGFHVTCIDNFYTGSRDNIKPYLANNRFELIEQSVVDQINGDYDCIFNLACPASPIHYQRDPIRTLIVSVIGTFNALAVACKNNAMMIQASTSEVYGDPLVHPQVETYQGNVDCTGPRACYDEGKRAAESLCFDAMRELDIDVRVARIFNTYGPNMHPDDGRVVSNFITHAISGRALTVYGRGTQTRSFCYVDDLIDQLLAIMDANRSDCKHPINIGNDMEVTIDYLAQTVLRLSGCDTCVTHMALPADDPVRRRPDLTRINALMPDFVRTTLDVGICRTIEYFNDIQKRGIHVH